MPGAVLRRTTARACDPIVPGHGRPGPRRRQQPHLPPRPRTSKNCGRRGDQRASWWASKKADVVRAGAGSTPRRSGAPSRPTRAPTSTTGSCKGHRVTGTSRAPPRRGRPSAASTPRRCGRRLAGEATEWHSGGLHGRMGVVLRTFDGRGTGDGGFARSSDEEADPLSPYLLSVVAKAGVSIPAPTSACRWARTRRPSASS